MNVKHVEVNTTQYQFCYGNEPRGQGHWIFEIDGKNVHQWEYQVGYEAGTGTMTYSAAKKMAQKYAAARNVYRINVCT